MVLHIIFSFVSPLIYILHYKYTSFAVPMDLTFFIASPVLFLFRIVYVACSFCIMSLFLPWWLNHISLLMTRILLIFAIYILASVWSCLWKLFFIIISFCYNSAQSVLQDPYKPDNIFGTIFVVFDHNNHFWIKIK